MAKGYKGKGEEVSFYLAKTTLEPDRRVALDADGEVVYATAAKRGIGTTYQTTDAGDPVYVQTTNVHRGTAGAVITAGDEIEVGVDGKVITLAAGVAIGQAAVSAILDGEIQYVAY